MFRERGALGSTLLLSRLFQAIAVIVIIGLSSNFVSSLISNNQSPPNILLGTLSITCVATLYICISTILYLDNLLPYLTSSIVDTCLLVCLLTLSIILGQPLSFTNCFAIGGPAGVGSGSSAYTFAAGVSNAAAVQGFGIDSADGVKLPVVFRDWVASTRATCFEMKAIWGLCVGLTVLFAFSGVSTIFMWKQARKGTPTKGDA